MAKPYRGFESTSLRQQVLRAEKIRRPFPQNARNMPVFRDIRSTRWTGENGLLGIEWRQRAGFSLDGKCAVRFQGSHKANAMRSKSRASGIAS